MPRNPELDSYTRTRICELHSAAHWGYKRIHKRYPWISLSTIRYTIKKERERDNNHSIPRSGGPRKLSEEDRDHIYVVTTNPQIRQVDLLVEVDHKVKINSIRRLLYEMDLRKWKQLEHPMLSELHAAKRLQWARTYESYTSSDWARVYWSDKCSVERGVGFRKPYTFTRPKDQLEKHDLCLKPCGKQIRQMFWAAFSGDIRRTGLIPLYGNSDSERGGIDSSVICELVISTPTLLNQPNAIFMHDNAPVHTAYIVRELLDDLGIEVMDWPPHSPDLKPIENLWRLLKAKIYEIYPELLNMPNNQRTLDFLVHAAQEAWEKLDINILAHLSETMSHRVKVIIEADGWYTKY